MAKHTIMTMLVMIDTQFARSIAYGVERRGSLVSSAKSAGPPPEQPQHGKDARARPRLR